MSHRSTWLALPVLLTALLALTSFLGSKAVPPAAARANDYLFCFWNVENLFDDKPDSKAQGADREFDAWFASDATARKLKLDNLSRALMELNGGRGPDILAVAEVETQRAAELLKDAMNRRIRDKALHYNKVLYRNPQGQKSIATAVITRLPVDEGKTKLLGRRQRILETHVKVNGHDLVVVAAHWSSRLSDKDGERRERYADTIYSRYNALHATHPGVDMLICGDFNDTPDDRSVIKHLHAIGNTNAVRQADAGPLLLNLMAGKDPAKYGTHYYHRWLIFDQIVISPGLLDDEGWTCAVDSVQTINNLTQPRDRLGRPWRFGSERDKAPRGYSDHFPVTVRLRVK